MLECLRWTTAKKTELSGIGLQLLSEWLQRMRRSELVAWCHVPFCLCISGSLAGISRIQGSSRGSVRFVVVRPPPRTFAKVLPRSGLRGSGMS